MKKRILSFCLLLAMVVTALPLAAMSVFAASGRASYEEEDYNTLYVQKGLVFAADFFDTNEYWGKDVAADLNAYAWTDTAAVFNTSTIPSGAVTGGYLLLNKFSDNLGVSNTASLTNLGQNGTTGEYVGVFTTTGDFAFVLNNIQINPTFADDEDGKRVMTVNKVGNYYNKADMKFRTGTGELLAFSAPSPMAVNTLTLTVDAPTYTLDYYGTTLSGVEEQATSWGVNFKVTHSYDEENGLTKRDEAETYGFAGYLPVVKEIDGKKYVVDAITRDGGTANPWDDLMTNTNGGISGGANFYATEPGHFGVYVDSVKAFASNDVYFPDNRNQNVAGGSTWLKYNRSFDADTKLYAFRQYNHILSATEMAQNHMADIAKFFKIDIGYIRLLNEASLHALYTFAAGLTFEDETAGEQLEDKAYELATEMYKGKLNAEALAVIADKQIDISGIRNFPDKYANVIFFSLQAYVTDMTIDRTPKEIQAFVDFQVQSTMDTYYGQYIDKTVYSYKDIYVRQDALMLAADFFGAKPTDTPIYVGDTYPTWQEKYDAAGRTTGLGYWKDLKDADGNPLYQVDGTGKVLDTSPVKNIAEALEWVKDNKTAAQYTDTKGYWKNLTDAEGKELYQTGLINGVWTVTENSPVKTLAAARTWLTTNKEKVNMGNNWAEYFNKYVWKGTTGMLSPLDIGDTSGYYAHDNIRRFGDGCLITGKNNSFSIRYAYDSDDVTYQMVTKMSGVSNWQLRGFRAAYSGLDKTLRLTGVQYNGYGVTGTKDVPKASNTQLLDYPMTAKEVSSVYSTDVTAVVDKYANVGLSYYKYTWNEATGKYDVVSVATSAEGNSGGISFFGRLDLDIYANGTRVFGVTNMPYNAGAPDSVGNGGANTYYAIRVYSTTLTPEEIAQNHFADLAGYYGYDLSLYYRLSEEDRAALHNQLKTLELGSPAADAVEKYESVFAGLYYRFATDSEESDTFREFAAKYKLAIENLAPLSPLAQDRIFKQFTTPEMLASEYVYPVLQDALENAIKTVRKNYYAESYVHTVTQFEGYQLRKTGEYGFRALFTLDADALGNIHVMYPTANVTIGTLLLPSTLAGETVVTVNPQGGVEYHSEIIDKTVAYDADGYTNDVFEYQGNLSYACEYILPEDGDVNTKFAFVNYVVIELEGEAPVVYTVNANTISGEGISLFELTQYAKENEGMAYENIQSLINDEVGTTDAVLTVGNGNISDYVIVEDGWNTPGVEQVVALVKQYIGVDMRVVTAAEAAAYERRLYIGRECDVKYEDADLYGLNASPYTLSLWYFDEDNCDAAIALFEEILMLAEGDSYTIETGTDYVRRAR